MKYKICNVLLFASIVCWLIPTIIQFILLYDVWVNQFGGNFWVHGIVPHWSLLLLIPSFLFLILGVNIRHKSKGSQGEKHD